MRRAPIQNVSCAFEPTFKALPGVQMRQTWACWKGLDVYFQPKWNFWIWCPFAPPKLQPPKTASCVSKRWQKVIFLLVFWPSGGSKLGEISWSSLSKCIFAWQIQKCKIFLKWTSQSKGSRTVGGKNLCVAQKIHNWQNFLQISWNLSWESPIKYHAQSKRLWPKFGVNWAFSVILVLWPTTSQMSIDLEKHSLSRDKILPWDTLLFWLFKCCSKGTKTQGRCLGRETFEGI